MQQMIPTPEGTRDRLFAECAAFRQVQRAVTDVFRRQGYCEMTTPGVEYYDLISAAGHPLSQEAMMKVVDRTGKILVMRPDCTVAMGRVAATKLRNLPQPMRLYYNQPVYRSNNVNTGEPTEIDQCGVELIGATGLKADLEVLSLAIRALDACGLTDYHIEIGHAGYFDALLTALDLDMETGERLRTLLETRELAAFEALANRFWHRPAGKALFQLTTLFGGVEVLEEAEAVCDDPAALAILRYLETLYQALDGAGLGDRVQFDLGLVHSIEYYTGMVFRGFSLGASGNVLSGGRYDKLIGRFGQDMPATGFALDVEAVASCLPLPEHKQPETVVYYDLNALGEARALVDSLPEGTAMLSCAETPEAAEAEARALGAKTLVLLENGTRREASL